MGKTTIDMSGKNVGQVLDIAYDGAGRLAIIVRRGDGSEKFFSIEEIVAIGDFVIVNPERSPAPPQGDSKNCPHCGKPNKMQNKYCVYCGKPI